MSRRPSGGEKTAQDRGAAHNVSSGRCASLVSATRDLVVAVMVVSDLSHNTVGAAGAHLIDGHHDNGTHGEIKVHLA